MKTPGTEDDTPPPRWERVESRPAHEYRAFSTRTDRSRSPIDGEIREFDVVESADAVTVIALTAGGEYVMIEQFRHGTREVTLELPGGLLDPGESPVDCARRELREETGYHGGDASSLGVITLNPSWQTTLIHLVVVQGAEPVDAKDLDDGEDTRVRLVTPAEARALARDGTFNTSVAMAALALFEWQQHGGREPAPR
jgi:ADP-ribose pyrophosphatase